MYFNEMNTVPGSLAWYLFCEKLSDCKQMLTQLIEQGICDFKAKSGKKMLKNCASARQQPFDAVFFADDDESCNGRHKS